MRCWNAGEGERALVIGPCSCDEYDERSWVDALFEQNISVGHGVENN